MSYHVPVPRASQIAPPPQARVSIPQTCLPAPQPTTARAQSESPSIWHGYDAFQIHPRHTYDSRPYLYDAICSTFAQHTNPPATNRTPSASPATPPSTPTTPSVACAFTLCFSQSLFTGKERDAESGNDYFEARYYSSSMGRFMSPDWSAKEEPVPYAKLDDPQTLNLYSYVQNNPLIRVDADGHQEAVSDTVIIVALGAYAVVGGLHAYYQTPAGERNLNTLASGTKEKFGSGVQAVKNTVTSILHKDAPAPTSPDVHPSEVNGKTPTEIDTIAKDKGLLPAGPAPQAGQGSYIDPVTGEQRVLTHPGADPPHAHVNNPNGERLGPDGKVVPKESPEAHIPIKKDKP